MLFGSRVKTSTETNIIKEVSSLSDITDKGITFTDWDRSKSKKLEQFKQKAGIDKYNNAKIEYGTRLKTGLEKLIGSKGYNKLDPEEKLKMINDIDNDAMESVFRKHYFTYTPPRRKK
jgi:hypothetical protein